jgi:hypothetical protein
MSIISAAKALLEADATLLATATGGIFDFDETGRMGIGRTNTPGAFDQTNETIKPCVLVKVRSSVPDYILADDTNQLVSFRHTLEVWFYQDSGFTTIETMRDRVYALLHARQFGGAFMSYWQGDVRFPVRDIEIDANVERSEYLVRAKRSV